jgi:lysophospholipase L1-like esterase
MRSAASALLLPVLFWQGRRVRRDTPRLPEAAGPREGSVAGQSPPLRLLVLGESTAAGVGAPDHARGLTGQIATALARECGRAVAWRVIARNGATAEVTRRELLAPAGSVRADIAVIVLGVNDTLQLHRSARWRRDLRALIEAVRSQCGEIPILLAGVPPIERFPALPRPLAGALGTRARLLDLAAAGLARSLPGVSHLQVDGEGHGDEFFCADRFHPSVHGYGLWGDELGRQAAAMLSSVDGPKRVSPG